MPSIKGQPAPKPQSTPDPVPGAAAESEFNSFLSSLPKESEFAATMSSIPQAQASADALSANVNQGNSILSAGGEAIGRLANAAGGIARTGLAAIDSAAGGENVVTGADVKNALVGKAPGYEEFLKRMGVPEGESFHVPGVGKVTQRGARGLAIDILSDPTTAIAKLAKSVPYVKKLLNAPGIASEALGEAVYKSALSSVDAKLAEKGSGSLSDVMLKEGAPVGGIEMFAQKVEAMSNSMGKIRQGLYDKAAQKGVTIDTEFPLKRAEAVLEGMRKDPGLAPSVSALDEMLTRYKSAGKVDLATMSQWKTNLYDSLPASAFDGHGALKGNAKRFKAALAADFRDAIVGAGNKAERGLGDAINALNEKWGTLIEARDLLSKGGRGTGRLGEEIDKALLAAGGIKAAATKKALDAVTGPYAKTVVGKALMEAGKKDVSNRLARQVIAQQTGAKDNK